MIEKQIMIPADPQIIGNALQKWSAKRVEFASERISDAGKQLFTASIGSVGLLITLLKFSSIPADCRTYFWWSIGFILLSAALSLGMVTILYFKLGKTSDLKKDFLFQQKIYHWILGFWFALWSVGVIFASKVFTQI